MKTVDLVQGSPEWHAHRRNHFNASDAPAMLGVSKYTTRNELLKEKATGITAEIDDATQERFDRGHEWEAMARPWAEEIIGEDLFPVVGVLYDLDGLPLSASFDGITMGEDVTWEHKTLNKELADCLPKGIIPPEYHPQLAQQLLISGAEKCLFMASSGDKAKMVFAWYVPDFEVSNKVVSGWYQFADDLKNFKAVAIAPAAVAAPLKRLPALIVQLTGEVTNSNLVEYEETARSLIRSINTDLRCDQDFADAAAMVGFCEKAEKDIETVKTLALAQTKSIDELFRTLDLLKEEMRSKRLELDKLVEARKKEIRIEITGAGAKAFTDHIEMLNTRIGKPYMPPITTDFPGVIKGKRTITSLHDAVDTELARAKIVANEIADRISLNMAHLREHAKDHVFLFNDTAAIVLKAVDDLASLVKARIADYKEQERIKAENLAKEEAAKKLAAEAEAKRLAELAAVPPVAVSAPVIPVPAAHVVIAPPAPLPVAAKDPDEIINTVVNMMRGMDKSQQLSVLNAAIAIQTKQARAA